MAFIDVYIERRRVFWPTKARQKNLSEHHRADDLRLVLRPFAVSIRQVDDDEFPGIHHGSPVDGVFRIAEDQPYPLREQELVEPPYGATYLGFPIRNPERVEGLEELPH